MPSSISVQKIGSRNAIKSYKDAPGDTVAHDVAWVDMRDFESFLFQYLRTSGTGGLTYKIIANDQSDGSGTDVVIKTGSSVPAAAGDVVNLECNAQEIRELGDAVGVATRYVSANLTNAEAGDEGAVVYVRGRGDGEQNLTVDAVS